MATSVLGTRVTRTEDPELLTGSRRYLADLELPDGLWAVFVRSEVAHAMLGTVHTDDARAVPGVVEVFLAATLGIPAHHGMAMVDPDFARPPLATDRVRFVGEAIALVVAETASAATDAAAMVWADYEPLDALVDPEAALADDADPIFPDHGSNRALVSLDPPVDLDAASAHVARGRFVNQKMAVVAMEPNAVAAIPDADGGVVVYVSNQMPHGVRAPLAQAVGLEPDQVVIRTAQVGGGFGGKAGLAVEYSAVTAAALQLGRPVRWTPTRSDDMVSLPHSRAQIQYAELGLADDGTFTGLRVHLTGDAGAYPGIGAYLPAGTKRMAQGPYRIPTIQFDVAVAVTNTTPGGAYRGAGRPEATALLERLVDLAAIESGIDPVELRRRNLLTADQFPYTTVTGHTYDTGNYQHPLDVAAESIGYAELRSEQAARRERGDVVQLGIGVAVYVEITAGGSASEFSSIEVLPDGSVALAVGTHSHGQGHQTAFAMLVHDATGIPIDRIRLVEPDTSVVPRGGGTGGSRSLQLGGSAVRQAAAALVDKAKRLAGDVLEADAADIVVDLDTATIGVAGVPARSLTWGELAQRVADEPDLIDHGDESHGLGAAGDFDQGGATFPFGAHMCVVEVDTETGASRVVRHVAVDDCGTVLNPLLVEGQQHGGVAAGIGQALYEQVVHDVDGNPLTATLVDYLLPTAVEIPVIEAMSTETPTPLNPLGAKGIGEASTIGSTPAVQNAIIDAVAHFGIRHLDMPCTPERVWAAIRSARAGNPPEPWRQPPAFFATLPRDGELDDDNVSAAEGV